MIINAVKPITLRITNNEINDIMDYVFNDHVLKNWAESVELHEEQLGLFAHDQISKGGSFVIKPIDDEGGGGYIFNKDSLVKGIKLVIQNDFLKEIVYHNGLTYRLNFDVIDGYIADVIVQYALFDEYIYDHFD